MPQQWSKNIFWLRSCTKNILKQCFFDSKCARGLLALQDGWLVDKSSFLIKIKFGGITVRGRWWKVTKEMMKTLRIGVLSREGGFFARGASQPYTAAARTRLNIKALGESWTSKRISAPRALCVSQQRDRATSLLRVRIVGKKKNLFFFTLDKNLRTGYSVTSNHVIRLFIFLLLSIERRTKRTWAIFNFFFSSFSRFELKLVSEICLNNNQRIDQRKIVNLKFLQIRFFFFTLNYIVNNYW